MTHMPTTASKGPSLKDVIARFGGEETLRKKPPVHLWNPPFCGQIDMQIARNGSWHYMGSPIPRPAMVKLFASILRREPDDSYVLVTPVEKCGIRVDDAPFVAVEATAADAEGGGRLIAFRTNVDDVVPLDAEHPLRVSVNPVTGEPSPYVLVRDRLEALLARPVYYQLVEMAEERILDGKSMLGVESAGQFFVLGEMP
jgi:hypothetical protein